MDKVDLFLQIKSSPTIPYRYSILSSEQITEFQERTPKLLQSLVNSNRRSILGSGRVYLLRDATAMRCGHLRAFTTDNRLDKAVL